MKQNSPPIPPELANCYDQFLSDIKNVASTYGDHTLCEYLTNFRARICAQINTQYKLITENGLEKGEFLTIGGWPGASAIILNRLTGINITIIDHPAMIPSALKDFYKENKLSSVSFDFKNSVKEKIPLNE